MSSEARPGPTEAPRVSVVIVTWNGLDLLRRCLDALDWQEGVPFETIVVDNGSADGTVAWLRETRPAVRLIVNRRNLGFAAANNQGIAIARGLYIATLNNDAYAEPGWLEGLVASLEDDPGAGSAASRMVQLADPGRFDSAGIAPDRLGFGWNLRAGLLAPEHERRQEVFGACAGAALYRRSMLDEIGLFDEQFGSYYEDVDLAWRARNAGWRCWYVPESTVWHEHSATGGRFPSRKRYLLGRNRLLTLAKNYPASAGPLMFLALVAADLAAIAKGALAGDLAPFWGRLAGLACVPEIVYRRATMKGIRRADWAELEPLLAPFGGHR